MPSLAGPFEAQRSYKDIILSVKQIACYYCKKTVGIGYVKQNCSGFFLLKVTEIQCYTMVQEGGFTKGPEIYVIVYDVPSLFVCIILHFFLLLEYHFLHFYISCLLLFKIRDLTHCLFDVSCYLSAFP